jgi:hypothetical protein
VCRSGCSRLFFSRVDEEFAFNGSLISLYTVRYIYSFLQMDVAL